MSSILFGSSIDQKRLFSQKEFNRFFVSNGIHSVDFSSAQNQLSTPLYWPKNIPLMAGVSKEKAFFIHYYPLLDNQIIELPTQLKQHRDICVSQFKDIVVVGQNNSQHFKLDDSLQSVKSTKPISIKNIRHCSILNNTLSVTTTDSQLITLDLENSLQPPQKILSLPKIIHSIQLNPNTFIISTNTHLLLLINNSIAKKIIAKNTTQLTRLSPHRFLIYQPELKKVQIFSDQLEKLDSFDLPIKEPLSDITVIEHYGNIVFHSQTMGALYISRPNIHSIKLSTITKANGSKNINISFTNTFPSYLSIKIKPDGAPQFSTVVSNHYVAAGNHELIWDKETDLFNKASIILKAKGTYSSTKTTTIIQRSVLNN